MFKDILDNYICDPKVLLKANGFTAEEKPAEEKPAEGKHPEVEEDDADFFTGGDNVQETPGSLAARINDIIANW